jgi:isochorismate hydrolase
MTWTSLTAAEIHKLAWETHIRAKKQNCKDGGIPVIYVTDNRGKWRSDFSAVLSHCLRPDSPGCPMVNQLIPEASDYIVLKPKHSAFYATSPDTLFRT